MEKLSVAIITKNNQDVIGRCLESLQWADEIVVLDGYSTDRTVEICRRFTDKVYQKEFESFPAERDYVLKRTSYSWILSADADMVFPSEFCEEVRHVLEAPGHDGYLARGLTTFLGREIRHCGWFDRRYLRLFNKEKGGYDLTLSVLDLFTVRTGNVGQLRHHFLHVPAEPFIDYFGKIARYAQLTAREYRAKGVRIRPANCWWYLIAKPVAVFLDKYVLKRGFLDGIPGLLVCLNSAISYYCSYAALWDMQRQGQ